jgi:hypothetical protein
MEFLSGGYESGTKPRTFKITWDRNAWFNWNIHIATTYRQFNISTFTSRGVTIFEKFSSMFTSKA